MKKLLLILIGFSAIDTIGQVPEPAIGWVKTFGGDIVDQVGSPVTKTIDGGFIVQIGSTSDYGTGNLDSFCALTGDRSIYLKYSADASTLEWARCSGNGPYIFPKTDGSFIYGGTTSAAAAGWAFKFVQEDASGGIIFFKKYGDSASAILRNMIQTNDGGYLMMGEVNYTDTDVLIHYGSWMDPDLWILKVDSNGNKLWSKVIGGTGYESGGKLVLAPDNGCYVVGGTGSNDYNCTGSHGGGEVYLARLDSNGNIIWHKDMGGSGEDVGIWACENGKGGVIIAAESRSNDGDVHNNHGNSDFWAIEVDSSGNILWDNCYGGSADEIPHTICKATDGSIWLGGESCCKSGEVDTNYTIMNHDAWFVHADSAGNFLSAKVLGSTSVNCGYLVHPLSTGGIIAGGYYGAHEGSFSTAAYYGDADAFLVSFAPWTVSVEQLPATTDIFINPNPATDFFQFQNLEKGLQYSRALKKSFKNF